MNLYLRFFFLLLKRIYIKTPQDVFTPCHTSFIVNPLDLDLNFHMNNGRYLSIMDLGRLDLMLKGKIFWHLVRKGYYPVVTSESIRFRKSLQLFQKFELISHIESWDEKDFYMSQKFIQNGELIAEGHIKGRFKQRGRKGSVPTKATFKEIGATYTEPHLSALAIKQKEIEKLLAHR